MASKVIGFRIPEDVAEELEKVSEEHGMTVAEFMRSLVDETLYPATENKGQENGDIVTREQVESLSNAHRDLTDKVQDLSTRVDRVTSKIAGYELEGILSPKIAEKIREIEKNKSNIGNLKNEVDIININLEASEKNIGNFSAFVLSSEHLFDHLQQEIKGLRSQLESTVNSSTKVSQLEEEVARLSKAMTTLKREIKRQPTDDIHTLTEKNGRERKFRVYNGKAGLVKPYRVAWDPSSSDKYIDLNEPLN
ncbi:hypothetical protein ACFLUZ_03605 [Chloroflexota bacterium]